MSFESWRSYWHFSDSVRSKQRYILDDESKNFLDSLIDTCQNRIKTMRKDSIVYRAQDGHSWRPFTQTDPETEEEIYVDKVPYPYPLERMKPLVDSAPEGRANPKGIPCLYLASDEETAMSEVRPWLDSIISVGDLKLKKDIKVLDFSIEHGKINFQIILKEQPSQEEIDKAVWIDIDNAFSKPTRASDSKSDYAPTQIISEYIKSKGYDGIAYKSSLADGHNIALFDLEVADVIRCSIYKTLKIKVDFEQVQE
ncbi:RES family NAD+ phosphorylase [Gammaproteobacteria bacterium]|nr:RES family NAD+ phosphorylase [Gammaproteobacteria bacterium]